MPEGAAELIIEGRIATLRGRSGFSWTDAIAIAEGRVMAVGGVPDMEPLRGKRTAIWRLSPDQVVTPSITDAHLHLVSAATAARQPDLTGLDRAGAVAAISRAHRRLLDDGDEAGWLLGHGWSFDALGEHPTAAWLDGAAPGRPVALWAHDHHSRWLSTTAIRAAGIGEREDPPAGLIEHDADGIATGVMYEAAAGLVDAAVPAPDAATLADAIFDYATTLAGLGVTSVHDPGELAPDPALQHGPIRYRSLAQEDRLPLRVTASVREEQLVQAIEIGFRSGDPAGPPGRERYRDGWLKLFSDGALGSRTAALLEPYLQDERAGPAPGGPTGMLLRTPHELREIVTLAAEAGIASQVHAIGDAAVRSVLDVMAGVPVVRGVAHRIEHAQLVDRADLARFGALGVAASVQPAHLLSDRDAMQRAWGPRAATAFALRSIDAGGAILPMGTDAPVEPPDPWPGIAVAVARRGPGTHPDEAFHPEQAIDLDRALRAACLDGPRSAGVSDEGHLGVGARADLLVLPADAFDGSPDPDAIGRIRPLATLLDGSIIYRAADLDP